MGSCKSIWDALGRGLNPRCRWPGLGLAVPDDASHNEIRVVHYGAERHGQGIPQLAALMNRARCLGVDVTVSLAASPAPSGTGTDQPWKPPRHGESRNQVPQPLSVSVILARVELLERAFQPEGSQRRGGSVARTDHVDHVEIMVADEQVKV